MYIVTAGSAFIDIDAYASAIAYAELLNEQGLKAQAVSTAPRNESISPTIRSWKVELANDYIPNPEDKFVMVDISDPNHFEEFVDPGRVAEVIDHHSGFQDHWAKRLGSRAQFELVGAVATLVYEKWTEAGRIQKMSTLSGKLLATAILDNTLNFKANISTDRDKGAYEQLSRQFGLSAKWPEQYFSEVQAHVEANLETAINNDTKKLRFSGFDGEVKVGQLVLWEADKIAQNRVQTFKNILGQDGSNWFANVVSIDSSKSYLIAQNPRLKTWLSGLLGVSFVGDVAEADRLWLRKEIINRSLEKEQK